MKKIILSMLLLLCVAMLTSASTPTALQVQKTDGISQSVSLVTIQRITFDSNYNSMVLITTEGTFQLPLADIQKLTFGTSTDAAVENLHSNTTRVLQSGNQLTVQSESAIQILYVVDMSGKVLVSQQLASVSEATVTLPGSGMFLLFMQTSQGYVARKVMNN